MAWSAYPIASEGEPIPANNVLAEIYDALDERGNVCGVSPLSRIEPVRSTAITDIRSRIESLLAYFYDHSSWPTGSSWVTWTKSAILTAYHGSSKTDWISLDNFPSAEIVNEIQGVIELLQWRAVSKTTNGSVQQKLIGNYFSDWDAAWADSKSRYPGTGTTSPGLGGRAYYGGTSYKRYDIEYEGRKYTITKPGKPDGSGTITSSEIDSAKLHLPGMAKRYTGDETNEFYGYQVWKNGSSEWGRVSSETTSMLTLDVSDLSVWDDGTAFDLVPDDDPSGSALDPFRPATPSGIGKYTNKGWKIYGSTDDAQMAIRPLFTHRNW